MAVTEEASTLVETSASPEKHTHEECEEDGQEGGGAVIPLVVAFAHLYN
jgi:hypothetical protein